MLEFRVHDITLVFIGKDKERERVACLLQKVSKA